MFGRMKTIRIADILCDNRDGTRKVSARINSSELWFESPNSELRPSAEAFASTMLLPALYMGADIVVEAPLSPTWVSNARRYLEIFGGWLKLPTVDIRSPLREPGVIARGEKTAICFSGGLDSFFTLLRGPFDNASLLMIHGFDIDLGDECLWEDVKKNLLEVSSAVGAEPIVIKTNIRKNPVFLNAPWEYAQGGALGAIGYVVDCVNRLVISSSYHYGQDHPWGSHWDTDPLLSSEVLEVVHWGAAYTRPDKLSAVLDEPLVKKHLRVCWENRDKMYNCSKCEKCIRTMLTIEALDKLDEYEVFKPEQPLTKVVDEMPFISNPAIDLYDDILDACPDFALSGKIRELIKRSRRHYKNKRGLPRFLAKVDQKLIRRFRTGHRTN